MRRNVHNGDDDAQDHTLPTTTTIIIPETSASAAATATTAALRHRKNRIATNVAAEWKTTVLLILCLFLVVLVFTNNDSSGNSSSSNSSSMRQSLKDASQLSQPVNHGISGQKEQQPTTLPIMDKTTFQQIKNMLLANADRKMKERRAWLSPQHSESKQFGDLQADRLFSMFTPVMPCLWTFEKEPASDIAHDGPKWVCGLQEVHSERSQKQQQQLQHGLFSLSVPDKTVKARSFYAERPCIVYSMGSNNDFAFERQVRRLAPGCEIHTFDPTVKETGDGKNDYDAYHGDYGFGGQDSTPNDGNQQRARFAVKSLATIMKELNHKHVDYLKIDVEGYEWGFLNQVEWNTSKVGQILIEFHPQFKKSPMWSSGVLTALDLNVIFSKLEMAGFRLISLEPVTYTNFGQVELVFLHKDWDPSGDW